MPYFEGMEKFPGRILHSHDFRSAEEFKGKNIVVIGTSYSAEDIASQCYKYGVNSVTCSYRTSPMVSLATNFKTVPLFRRSRKGQKLVFLRMALKFQTLTQSYCTGYLHSFPFIHPNLRLKTANDYGVMICTKNCMAS